MTLFVDFTDGETVDYHEVTEFFDDDKFISFEDEDGWFVRLNWNHVIAYTRDDE